MVKWFDDLWLKLTGKKKAKRKYTRKPGAAAKAAATRREKALKVVEQSQQKQSEKVEWPFPTAENVAKADTYLPVEQQSIVGDFDKAAEKFREIGNGAASWDRN
jgi:hypothetical protein